MNATEAGFIEAMADAPEDPGPRIVFADWLLERGDPRGDYFRLHHEVAHGTPSNVVEKRFAKLAARELRRVLPGDAGARFADDGLLWRVDVTLGELFGHAERLFSLGPIHTLRVRQTNGRIHELARFEPLRWVFGLDLETAYLTASEVTLLAASPHLRRLRGVNLNYNSIGPAGVAAFVALPDLISLDVAHTGLANDVGGLLPAMPRLRALSLTSNHIEGDSVEILLGAARELTYLNLSYNPIGVAGAQAIAAASHLGRLRTLSLERCRLEDAGIAALASAEHLDKLRTLIVNDNDIGPFGAAMLLSTETFRSLRDLRLEDNPRIAWDQRLAIARRFTRD